MNTLPRFSRTAFVCSLAALTGLAAGGRSQAQTNWTNLATAAANWNVNANWNPATFPNGIDANANMGVDITVNQTITLGAAITVGTLTFGDIDSSNTMTI